MAFFHDPFTSAPAPISHVTALTSVEQDELRQHRLDHCRVRISDALQTTGPERTHVEALLVQGWRQDVRHLAWWKKTGLVVRATELLDRLQASGGGIDSADSSTAQCIVVELHDTARNIFEPAAVQVVECDGNGRVLRVKAEIDKYKGQMPDVAHGARPLVPVGREEGHCERRDREEQNAVAYQQSPYLKQGGWDPMFAHEVAHEQVLGRSSKSHHLCETPRPYVAPLTSRQ
jgi:hypothetical protein